MGKLVERPGAGGTVINSRSKHEFSAKKGLGRVGRSTFLLGADQRLSGEGVFNGIYYCPLGLRAPCTCIPLCMRLVILMFWLRASTLSTVNSLLTATIVVTVTSVWKCWDFDECSDCGECCYDYEFCYCDKCSDSDECFHDLM